MKKLRLLFTKDCDRDCKLCCNKSFNLNELDKVKHFNYDEIMITGGEPTLYLKELYELLVKIKQTSKAKVYLYTARPTSKLVSWLYTYNLLDGITLTIHNKRDLVAFNLFISLCNLYKPININYNIKSLIVKIFKGIELKEDYSKLGWIVKDNIEWIKDCPLPKNEEFKRYEYE